MDSVFLMEKLIDIALTIFITSTVGFICWRIGFINGFRKGQKNAIESVESSR